MSSRFFISPTSTDTDIQQIPIHRFGLVTTLLLASSIVIAARVFLWITGISRKNSEHGTSTSAREPPMVPYLIPWFGHAFSLLRDFEGTFLKATERYRSIGIYTLYAGGQKMYIAANPRMIREMERREKTLSPEPLAEMFMRDQIGVPQESIDQLKAEPNVFTAMHPLFKEMMLSGPWLEGVTQTAGRDFEELIGSMLKSPRAADSSERPGLKSVAIIRWIRDTSFQVMTDAIYGKTLLKNHPELVEAYMIYEEKYWQIFFNVPHFFSPGAKKAIEVSSAIMAKWYQLPLNQRRATAVPEIVEAKMRERGLSLGAISGVSMTMLFGIHSNLMKVISWMVLHIITDPELTRRIRDEISPAFDSEGHLIASECIVSSSPLLLACFFEVVRYTSGSLDYRLCTEDTMIGNFCIKKGGVVMAHCRELHLSEELWGPDARTFNPYRFLEKPKLSSSPCFRAFGGGSVLCPGRVVARQTAMIFVAMLLQNYELELPGGKDAIPKQATKIPNPSILDITPEKLDLRVFVTKRSY